MHNKNNDAEGIKVHKIGVNMYKVYVDIGRGYADKEIVSNKEILFNLLDTLILENKIKQVLVIEYNKELDSDIPYYLYTGDTNKYIIFKENNLSKGKMRRITK